MTILATKTIEDLLRRRGYILFILKKQPFANIHRLDLEAELEKLNKQIDEQINPKGTKQNG